MPPVAPRDGSLSWWPTGCRVIAQFEFLVPCSLRIAPGILVT